MFIAAAIVSVLLAASMAYAAVRKLSHQPGVVRTYERVGVPEDKLNRLAITLVVGASGLLMGLLWVPIGIAAAIRSVCYFLLAIGAHIRFKDAANLPTPVTMALLAGVALVLHVAAL